MKFPNLFNRGPKSAELVGGEIDVDRLLEKYGDNKDVINKAQEIGYSSRSNMHGENQHLKGLCMEFKEMIRIPNMDDHQTVLLAEEFCKHADLS